MHTYENHDEPLFEIFVRPHLMFTNKYAWICRQPNCDGVHHYYRKLSELASFSETA